MPAKKKNKINLLPQEGFEASAAGRILKWALTTFRIMVIATELVVMGAFLSRFWLDAKNSDLNEELNTNKVQVLAYSDVESTIRSNQDKLAIAKSLYSQKSFLGIIDKLSKIIPMDVSFNSIAINGNVLTINASSFTEQSIMQFLINLDSDDDLTDVNLSQVSSSADNYYLTIFTIKAKIKGISVAKEE